MTTCETCHDEGTVEIICPYCEGEGKVKETCPDCVLEEPETSLP